MPLEPHFPNTEPLWFLELIRVKNNLSSPRSNCYSQEKGQNVTQHDNSNIMCSTIGKQHHFHLIYIIFEFYLLSVLSVYLVTFCSEVSNHHPSQLRGIQKRKPIRVYCSWNIIITKNPKAKDSKLVIISKYHYFHEFSLPKLYTQM